MGLWELIKTYLLNIVVKLLWNIVSVALLLIKWKNFNTIGQVIPISPIIHVPNSQRFFFFFYSLTFFNSLPLIFFFFYLCHYLFFFLFLFSSSFLMFPKPHSSLSQSLLVRLEVIEQWGPSLTIYAIWKVGMFFEYVDSLLETETVDNSWKLG